MSSITITLLIAAMASMAITLLMAPLGDPAPGHARSGHAPLPVARQ